ncbi:MAG: FHA domain-containing protein [Planctomycetes bacterium]|nr:FHA domain-containing protein [Planctomycetota bacterium]
MSISPAHRERLMTVNFVTFGKTGERKEFTLEKKSTVIGRKTDADLRIPIAEISRAHCEITRNGSAVTLRDLGSSNGTFVNGERIDDAIQLAPGDRIRIGSITFIVQIDGKPSNITSAHLAPTAAAKPAAPDGKSAPAKTATADAATELGNAADSAIDDLDDLDIDDLDVDDLSDIDFTEEGSGDLDDLEELSADDLIEEDDDEPKKK